MFSRFLSEKSGEELVGIYELAHEVYESAAEQSDGDALMLMNKELADNYPGLVDFIEIFFQSFEDSHASDDFTNGYIAGAFIVAQTLRVSAENYDLHQSLDT